jgi:membrane dipeptidase
MHYIIDAHQDMSYCFVNFNRDYRFSAAEIRRQEEGTAIPDCNGQTLLGWEEYQRGKVAAIFSTLFVMPAQHVENELEKVVYKTAGEAAKWFRAEYDYYQLLNDSGKFSIIRTTNDLKKVLSLWEDESTAYPNITRPVGLILLMEGVEAIGKLTEMESWWEAGVRIAGPVWSGSRFCGGTFEYGGFTSEGFALLEIMAELGYILDISHMTEKSTLQALEAYSGGVLASHANARALLKEIPGERHFTDHTIRKLVERDSVLGLVPFNSFLSAQWKPQDERNKVTLDTLIGHIDYVCQLAGSARHVGFGTDFDGGFGWPNVPYEIDTIVDLQKLHPLLLARGYNEEDISGIFGGNFRRILDQYLPS